MASVGDPHHFDFDLDEGIRAQVIEKLESSPILRLARGVGPRESGVYALYYLGDLVYVGKASKEMQTASEAEFYVVLVPGALGAAQVAEVKFIRGDEKLRPLDTALKTVSFGLKFPDERATKVIRRGTAFCKDNGGQCSFVMLSPEMITSVD